MKSVRDGISAIKQVPFFGTFKIILLLLAVAGVVVIVSAVREGLYGEKQSNYADFGSSRIEKVVVGSDKEEKLWYWEAYLENDIGKLGDTILGLKIGRKF